MELDSKAYSQAYEIIKFLLKNGDIVISENLANNIEQIRNKEYNFNINDIKETELLEDTKKILCVVYLEGIAENKEELIKNVEIIKKLVLKDTSIEEEINKELLPLNTKDLKLKDKILIALKKLTNARKKAFYECN
mgnify:FL=1